jgi:polysaccharide biosynthesis/export protein
MLSIKAGPLRVIVAVLSKEPQVLQVGHLLLWALAVFLVVSRPTSAQTTGAIGQSPSANSVSPADEYKIGPDDVLAISVVDAPEFSGRFRVSDAGVIEIPGLSPPIHAEGQSALELSHAIGKVLVDAKQLRDPRVSVFVEEYHGRTIAVLGAVTKPAVYPLHRRTTVLDALSMAGGALPNAGTTVTVVRGRASAEATGTAVGSVAIIDINRLVKGEDLSANVEVKNEDIISVSASQVVYVVGAVRKPGGFTMANPTEGISVVQAVALAEGMHSTASAHHGLIVRQSTNDRARQEIPVDIAQMITGKTVDVLLAPNDILYIPESGTKQTLKAMGDFALAAATGIAIYGIGLKIGQH